MSFKILSLCSFVCWKVTRFLVFSETSNVKASWSRRIFKPVQQLHLIRQHVVDLNSTHLVKLYSSFRFSCLFGLPLPFVCLFSSHSPDFNQFNANGTKHWPSGSEHAPAGLKCWCHKTPSLAFPWVHVVFPLPRYWTQN
jgi:hypothetical protein